MKKKIRINTIKRWYVLVALMIIAVCALAFLSRGWLRKSVIPGGVGVVYSHGIDNALAQQYKDLSQPFSRLGLGTPSLKHDCVTAYARHLHTDVLCGSTYSAYSNKVGNLDPSLGVRAAEVDAVLKAHGWQNYNTSLTTLGQNITKNIDWTPDAAYSKIIGHVFCLADFNTAFSTPNPEALAGNISCSRYIQVLGPRCGAYPMNPGDELSNWYACDMSRK